MVVEIKVEGGQSWLFRAVVYRLLQQAVKEKAFQHLRYMISEGYIRTQFLSTTQSKVMYGVVCHCKVCYLSSQTTKAFALSCCANSWKQQ